MKQQLDKRRIGIYLLFAFGIAWLTGLVIALTGGIANSPVLIPSLGLTLALFLMAAVYMFAPTLANVLTRLVTREGWQNTWLRPHFKRGWKFWLAAMLLTPLFTILGGVIYYLVFPSQFDPSLGRVRLMLPAGAENMNPWVLIIIQVIQAVILGAVINSLFTFGEEFGWRAYLLQKLLPLGARRALVVSGVIWGAWHWALTVQGHNYGLDYPGYPWLGMLMMIWFTVMIGILFGWATLRARSVWPAVLGHAVMNGIGAISGLVAVGPQNPVIGPSPAGIVGSLAFTAFAAWVLLSPRSLPLEDENPRADFSPEHDMIEANSQP